MKKIAFIITGLTTGGAELMLLRLLERLDRSRFAPLVVSLSSKGEIGLRIEALGTAVEALGMRFGRLPGPLPFLRLVRRLRAFKPDIAQTWMYHADLLGGLAARLAGAGAVTWAIHTSNLDKDKTKLMTRMVVKACARLSHAVPDRILSCSETARRIHAGIGYAADKMTVIPNGFDLSLFRPDPAARAEVRAELGLAADAPLAGLIGRYDPQKNHAGFLQAAGILHKRMPAARFLLAGREVDSGNAELMRAADTAGVREAAVFLGQRGDIPRLMAALDVLVSSSSYGEAFPLVLGEAMACGVPCAVTDVGDSVWIVGETGRAVPPGDMAGLAAAVESLLLLRPEERTALGGQARARVSEHFEIGQVVRRYEALYEELAAEAHVNGVQQEE